MAAPLILTRVEHQAVVTLLEALDGELLARYDVVFAGGTRLSRPDHRRACFERLDVRNADALVPFIETLRVESQSRLES